MKTRRIITNIFLTIRIFPSYGMLHELKITRLAGIEPATHCLAYRIGLLRPFDVAVWTMSSPFQVCGV